MKSEGVAPSFPEAVPEPMVRAQLARMLDNPVFSRSIRVSKLFQYLVEETLAGRKPDSEREIGAELYARRDRDFNPVEDSNVRADAASLRNRLLKYYAEVSGDPVRISLPRGAYVPEFQFERPPAQPGHGVAAGMVGIDGSWQAEVTYIPSALYYSKPQTFSEVFTFEVSGEDVDGTATFRGAKKALEDGKLIGARLTFITRMREYWSSSVGASHVIARYRGRVLPGEIKFVLVMDGDSFSGEPVEFTARRVIGS